MMPLRRLALAFGGILGSLLAVGCGPGTPADVGGSVEPPAGQSPLAKSPILVTTCQPVDWLTRRLVADAADVRLILPTSADAATWQPAPEAIASLVDADLILAHHPEYERWMATASVPLSTVVYAGEDLDLIERSGRRHSHGPEGEHSHVQVEPRSWIDPSLMLAEGRAIRDALERLDLDQAAIDRRLATLEMALGALDDQLRATLVGREIDIGIDGSDGSDGSNPVSGIDSEPGGHQATEYLTRRYSLSPASSEAPTARLSLLERADDGGSYDYLSMATQNLERLRATLEPAAERD